MAYAIPADLLTRFDDEEIAQVTDRGVPRLVTGDLLVLAIAGGDLSGYPAETIAAVTKAEEVLNQAISDAESAIDGYLAGRYSVPLSPVPAVIKRLACDVARYYLHDDHATESVQKRYDAAIAYLRDVAANKVALGIPLGAEPVKAAGGSVEMVTAGKVFGRPERGL